MPYWMLSFSGSIVGVSVAGPVADRFGRRGGMVRPSYNIILASLI